MVVAVVVDVDGVNVRNCVFDDGVVGVVVPTMTRTLTLTPTPTPPHVVGEDGGEGWGESGPYTGEGGRFESIRLAGKGGGFRFVVVVCAVATGIDGGGGGGGRSELDRDRSIHEERRGEKTGGGRVIVFVNWSMFMPPRVVCLLCVWVGMFVVVLSVPPPPCDSIRFDCCCCWAVGSLLLWATRARAHADQTRRKGTGGRPEKLRIQHNQSCFDNK